MKYLYKCDNEKCAVTTVEVNKPMVEYNKKEICPSCDRVLTRVYKNAISTGDGFKG